VLLVVLWVRSYQHRESLYGHFPIQGYLQITSNYGGLAFIVNGEHWKQEWRVKSSPAVPRNELNPVWMFNLRQHARYGFWWDVSAPYWFLLPLTTALTVAPWIRWTKRFSLRTLLIATTLVGLVLGLVVWASSRQAPLQGWLHFAQ
jgi:hypothetical protein